MRVAVLTYHGNNVGGHDYAANDHVALAADLALLARLEVPVYPLAQAVDALLGGRAMPPGVALSCDDGSGFDWYDLEHPTLGMQRSFANVLRDAVARRPDRPLHLTSFVIASPQARATLDATCLIGRGWWGDEWWDDALASGRMAIESHSFDHQHETLPRTASGLPGGTFANVRTHAAADAEIRAASDCLDARLPQRRTTLFAYPYGEHSPYLVDEYLPRHQDEHRLQAAFTTEPAPLMRGADRWRLPRYVCGPHWSSPEALRELLREALALPL
jgi:hypothetical protein